MVLKRFWQSRAGNFGMMMAVGAPAILAAVGLAIDVSSLMTAKTNLQNALDSAVLAASRLIDESQPRAQVFDGFFAANVQGRAGLQNATAELSVDQGINYIKTSATAHADVALHFAFIFGKSARVSATASAYESTNELEVVMVLDNTGSMGVARMAALRTAAASLLDIMEGAKKTSRKVRVSLVPFVTAVNVKGEGYDSSWIDTEGKSPTNGINFKQPDENTVHHLQLFKRINESKANESGPKIEWKGCVEARAGAYNVSDDAPDQDKPETLFVPYFAPDEPGNATAPSGSYGNSQTDYNNSYLNETVGGTDSDKQKSLDKYSKTAKVLVNETAPLTVGPNRACPTPIVPLTDDFEKLRQAVSGMQYWNGSGTNVSEGLSWGMRVLSPGEPYTQASPFKTQNTSKAVLLLTDGENVVYGSKNTMNKSDYGPYGFLASNRFGSTNQTTAARNVDDWTLDVCDRLKEQDVQIFTVLLQADTPANRALYSACASSPANYYPTNDVSQLESVFSKIASSVAQLYVTN